jgi:hypothetical protein
MLGVGRQVSKVPETVVNDRGSVSAVFIEKHTYTKAGSDRIGRLPSRVAAALRSEFNRFAMTVCYIKNMRSPIAEAARG